MALLARGSATATKKLFAVIGISEAFAVGVEGTVRIASANSTGSLSLINAVPSPLLPSPIAVTQTHRLPVLLLALARNLSLNDRLAPKNVGTEASRPGTCNTTGEGLLLAPTIPGYTMMNPWLSKAKDDPTASILWDSPRDTPKFPTPLRVASACKSKPSVVTGDPGVTVLPLGVQVFVSLSR